MKGLCIVVLVLSVFTARAYSLTLEEGLRVIAEKGRDIRISAAEEEQARQGVSLARSPLYPLVNAFAGYTWFTYQTEAVTPSGSLPLSQRQYPSFGLTVNQLVYDFGKTFSRIAASKYSLDVKYADTLRVRNDSSQEFIITYLDLLEAEKMLVVARDEVDRFELHLKDTQALFDEGMITKNDVLEAEVVLSDARQRALPAENLRDVRASRINSLLFRPLNDPVDAQEAAVNHDEGISLEEAWDAALSERPEVKEADAGIRTKKEEQRAVRSEFFPAVFVSGGYQYEENKYMVRNDNWSLTAGVNVNLFSGGATVSRIKSIESEITALEIKKDKLLDAIRLDVKSAYLELGSAKKRVEVTEKAVSQAEENLRLQRLRYQEGVATATDVLDAVTLRSRAEANYWSGIYGVKRAEARLEYAMGRDLFQIYRSP